MTNAWTIGIDVGTTRVKACLRHEGTELVARSEPYETLHPQTGFAEQNAEDWVEGAAQALTRLEAITGPLPPERTTYAFTGQMHTHVLTDVQGRPARRAILWSDTRAAEQCRRLGASDLLDREWAAAVHPGFTACPLMWVREHELAVASGASQFVLAKDYVRAAFTGDRFTDPSDASATGLAEGSGDRWSADALAASAVPSDWLPEIVASSTLVPADPSRPLGRYGVKTIVGGGDMPALAWAHNIDSPNRLAISLGTSAVVMYGADRPGPGRFAGLQPGTWIRVDSLHAGGSCLSWVAKALGLKVKKALALASRVPPGCDGLVFLPFLAGERGVTLEQSLPAGFVGLNERHGAGHLVRAVLEGVAIELARLARNLSEDWTRVETITCSGGGANQLWLQILADAMGRPVSKSSADSAQGIAEFARGRHPVGPSPKTSQPRPVLEVVSLRYLDLLDRMAVDVPGRR